MTEHDRRGPSLKRDLGSLESYAVLIGILIGAGIFRVTSDATLLTGPSVLLAHLVLTPVVLATSVAYLVFLSTPLGREPGGEVLHISSTLRIEWLTFLAAWLKLIAYLGAGAYLADALAINLLELLQPGAEPAPLATRLVALGALGFFFTIQSLGVRWFGRLQVAMCMLLAVSLAVLVLPGLFAIELANYSPFFTGGAKGFGASLTPLFFAYAGFESLAQAAGEVKDSQQRLPRIFVLGILATSLIFVSMSAVAFGVLPSSELGASGVPMSIAAATYLPFGAASVVTLGAVMAVATSLNVTLLVPARLGWHLAMEGQVPALFGRLHANRRTPVLGLAVCVGMVALLLLSGQMGLALGIAVVALMSVYALHSLALILLPRRNPALFAQVRTRIPRGLQLCAAWTSLLSLGWLVLSTFVADALQISESSPLERWRRLELTSLELFVGWTLLGLLLFRWSTRRARSSRDSAPTR